MQFVKAGIFVTVVCVKDTYPENFINVFHYVEACDLLAHIHYAELPGILHLAYLIKAAVNYANTSLLRCAPTCYSSPYKFSPTLKLFKWNLHLRLMGVSSSGRREA